MPKTDLKVVAQQDRHEFVIRRDVVPTVDVLSAIRGRGKRYAQSLDILLYDWPITAKVVSKFYQFLSENIEIEHEPVFFAIIEKALDAYKSAVNRPHQDKLDDPLRLLIFIEALIDNCCQTLDIAIVDGAGHQWKVDSRLPFVEWLVAHPGDLKVLSIGKTEQGDTRYRKAIYQVVADPTVQNIFRKEGYEQTVLASRHNPGS